MIREKILKNKNLILYFAFFIFLFFSTYNNLFHITAAKFFEPFQRDSESLVLGGMIKSNDPNTKSFMGLGRYVRENTIQEALEIIFEDQYQFYNQEKLEGKFGSYLSQFGLQGFFFSWAEKQLTFLKNEQKIEFFYIFNAFIFTFFLSFFALWVRQEWGNLAFFSFFLGIIPSSFMLAFARNLYWVMWTWYLPFIIVLYFLYREQQGKKYAHFLVFISVFLSILIKALCGYEYLSTITLAAVTPLIYYGILNRWTYQKLFLRIFSVGVAAVVGFSAAVFLHVYLLQLEFGNWQDAFHIFYDAVSRRTAMKLVETGPDEVNSDRISLWWIIFEFICLGKIWYYPFSSLPRIYFVLLNVGFFIWFYLKNKKFNLLQDMQIKAFLFTLGGAFLAVLSWTIVAKAHAAVHTHMNPVLWHLPYTLYFFSGIGLVIQKAKNRKK